MTQGCFGGPTRPGCTRDATTLCGLCDGHYCGTCIGPHCEDHHSATKRDALESSPEDALRQIILARFPQDAKGRATADVVIDLLARVPEGPREPCPECGITDLTPDTWNEELRDQVIATRATLAAHLLSGWAGYGPIVDGEEVLDLDALARDADRLLSILRATAGPDGYREEGA